MQSKSKTIHHVVLCKALRFTVGAIRSWRYFGAEFLSWSGFTDIFSSRLLRYSRSTESSTSTNNRFLSSTAINCARVKFDFSERAVLIARSGNQSECAISRVLPAPELSHKINNIYIHMHMCVDIYIYTRIHIHINIHIHIVFLATLPKTHVSHTTKIQRRSN